MDGGVPATPAAFAKTDQPRVAKPNEVSYSQNWSPLINTTGTVARGGRTKRGAAAQVRPFCMVHTVTRTAETGAVKGSFLCSSKCRKNHAMCKAEIFPEFTIREVPNSCIFQEKKSCYEQTEKNDKKFCLHGLNLELS